MSPRFDLDRIGGRKALDRVVEQVLRAGDHARSLFESGKIDWYSRTEVARKLDRSPVTSADHAVEVSLATFLASAHPRIAFRGEETGSRAPTSSREGLEWVLDPIDGTRAFLRGLPTWSVLLALLEYGRPVVGIAYLPAAGDLFTAVRGDGAFGNGRPLRVSQINALEDATIAHGTIEQFITGGCFDRLKHVGARAESTRGFCDFDGYRRLLWGQVDAMIDPGIQPWDIAAAMILLEEAGGVLTSFEGVPTIDGPGALASNGLLHDELLSTFSRA